MASRKLLMNAFFDQLSSFIGELSSMYPDDPDFPLFSTTLTMIRKSNPSLAVKTIAEIITPFETRIFAKDENFFLEFSDFSQYEVDVNIFSKLKTYYTTMSNETKEIVWKYIHNIMKLVKSLNN